MEDKIIVSNSAMLIEKYKNKGLKSIQKELKKLIAADKKRGIKTRVLYVDKKNDMKKIKGKAVTNPKNPRQNKRAIDAIFKKFNPQYLMILGAHDVIPYQDLDNHLFDPLEDADRQALGDLPYACDASYSKDPAKFVGPTRVVGRLPDLVAARKLTYLISLIKTATKYKKRSPKEYAKYFGLSAEVWEGSTEMSIVNTFGEANNLLLSPPAGPKHSKNRLQKRMHFINCHGASSSPQFFGQQLKKYPVSLTTKSIQDKILEGTIASVECCYGAELYDSITLGLDMPICQSYLKQGAYGYHGSTTIAYGPPDDNGLADLICQYFLQSVLSGASIGRAALVARQKFIEQSGELDPYDLKTLSQFNLLGDPSIHPVAKPSETILSKSVPTTQTEHFSRTERRKRMKKFGNFLKDTKPTASKQIRTGGMSSQKRTALSNIAKIAGLSKVSKIKTFIVKETKTSKTLMAKSKKISIRYLISIGSFFQ